MTFSSPFFLFLFLPVTLLLYYLITDRLKNTVLLIASLFFYAWGEPVNILIMLCSIVVNYALALLIARGRAKRLWMIVSVTVNIGLLFVFKYLNETVRLFGVITGIKSELSAIALPVGISFYTFQILSYVLDVYRGKVPPRKNILDVALYVSLFPQLIAGPIVRYTDIASEIRERAFRLKDVPLYEGCRRFAAGFAKKVLIADQLAALTDMAYNGTANSVWIMWLTVPAYALQLYYDFSGYSDMAIGMGLMFGFHFPENFRYPYISSSIREFWTRWHITLGGWFRDYLYIPMGGSRKGTARTCLHLLLVFLANGIWHGAGIAFLIFGLYNGSLIVLERLLGEERLKRVPSVLRHAGTVFAFAFGLILFRADNLQQAAAFVSNLFTVAGKDGAMFRSVMNLRLWLCLAAGVWLAMPHPRVRAWLEKRKWAGPAEDVLRLLVFAVAVFCMMASDVEIFIYFRF